MVLITAMPPSSTPACSIDRLARSRRAVEECQKADRHHAVELFLDPVIAQVGLDRIDCQGVGRNTLLQVADCGGTCIQRQHRAAASGCSQREVAEAAAEIEHAPPQVRQRGQFEGIQLKVLRLDLLAELMVEKIDTGTGGDPHG